MKRLTSEARKERPEKAEEFAIRKACRTSLPSGTKKKLWEDEGKVRRSSQLKTSGEKWALDGKERG